MNDIEMHWEDPPTPHRRVVLPGRTMLFVEELKRHPGKWARYVSGTGKGASGASTQHRLRELGAETRMSTLDDDGNRLPTGAARIWARWPEVEP